MALWLNDDPDLNERLADFARNFVEQMQNRPPTFISDIVIPNSHRESAKSFTVPRHKLPLTTELMGILVIQPRMVTRYIVIDDPIPSIGDKTCAFNALDSRLRCAVNPCGPCEGCSDYEPRGTTAVA
jgi:hypothetical protein